MSFLGDISFGLLGKTSAEEAADSAAARSADAAKAAKFNPVGVQSGIGSATYDPNRRLFTSKLDPSLQRAQYDILRQFKGEGILDLLRQQAAPFEEQQGYNLENRLFKQGILEHSQVDQPGGARRSFFDSLQNADLQRQLTAQSYKTNALNQLMGINNLSQSLFGSAQGLSGLSQAAGQVQGGFIQQQGIPGISTGQQQTGFYQDVASSLFGGLI